MDREGGVLYVHIFQDVYITNESYVLHIGMGHGYMYILWGNVGMWGDIIKNFLW